MPFNLVYYSQQDPQWRADILGDGHPGDTIGYIGCALTSVSMLLSGHGYAETPQSLNQKLKSIKGFAGAGIRWGAVSQLHPQITLKAIMPCANSDAPLAQIDASIAAGQPAVVQVDSTPAPGILTHWVLLYARKGSDYLMLDPWPYQTDVTKETLLMPRYSQGNTLQRAIMNVIIYECSTATGPVSAIPALSGAAVSSLGHAYARVKAGYAGGVGLRSSLAGAGKTNIIATVPPGTQLSIIDSDGAQKIGAINEWIRVRDLQGHEGFVGAWYLEKAAAPEGVTVRVKSGGTRVLRSPAKGSPVISTERATAKLIVLESAEAAEAKISKAGQWLMVKTPSGKQGYVDADSVIRT